MLWVLVTIVLPLVLPVLAMLCLQLFPQVVPTADWITPIKDGQLCWGAIGMAFSGMYDVLFPIQTVVVDVNLRGFAVIGLAISIFVSAIIAAFGSVAPTPVGGDSGKSWLGHYAILKASLALTIFTAIGYAVIHIKTN